MASENKISDADMEYLSILDQVIYQSTAKSPSRGNVSLGSPTRFIPHVVFHHDMQTGFPLLTTKFVPFKSVCVELDGFLHGETDKRWYQERKCKFWDHWSTKHGPDYDLGPLGYSWQWRNFNTPYIRVGEARPALFMPEPEGADQIQSIIDTLKESPFDRRMVCSAWNPLQLEDMALPPCHMIWGLVCTPQEEKHKLNLWCTMRSCDVGIGLPCNIASYALLLSLFCHFYGFEPGLLSIFMADCHVYENHVQYLTKQLYREPYLAPSLEITTQSDNMLDWSYQEVVIHNYKYHPSITLPITV